MASDPQEELGRYDEALEWCGVCCSCTGICVGAYCGQDVCISRCLFSMGGAALMNRLLKNYLSLDCEVLTGLCRAPKEKVDDEF